MSNKTKSIIVAIFAIVSTITTNYVTANAIASSSQQNSSASFISESISSVLSVSSTTSSVVLSSVIVPMIFSSSSFSFSSSSLGFVDSSSTSSTLYNSSSSTTEEDIPESIKIDSKTENKIKNCVSKYAKTSDVIISVLQDTINDSEGPGQIGIALAKKDPKSKKKRQAETYSFTVKKGKVKCKSVASEINQVKEPTLQDIADTQKKYKAFTEKMKNRKELPTNEDSKIPADYIPRSIIEDMDESYVSLFSLFDTPKVQAGINSGNNPSSIFTHESLLINTSKELGVTNKNQVAYIAATGYHETGQFIDFIENCQCGDPYTYYENKYGRYSDVGPGLGNTFVGDGAKYLGRGYVHITGRSNYQKYKDITGVDVISTPSLAGTNKDLAAFITIDGMVNGRFTGAKLGTFINSTKSDYYYARQTVNGVDKADDIARYTRDYYLTDSRIINYNSVSTTPTLTPPTTSKVLFRRKGTTQCLNIYNPVNNSTVNTWTCSDTDGDQKWEVVPVGTDGTKYNYKRVGTNQCLNALNPSNGVAVKTWTCDGSAEQQFNYSWVTQKLSRVGTANNTQCVAKASPANGLAVITSHCDAWNDPNYQKNFQWEVLAAK